MFKEIEDGVDGPHNIALIKCRYKVSRHSTEHAVCPERLLAVFFPEITYLPGGIMGNRSVICVHNPSLKNGIKVDQGYGKKY